MGQKVSTIPVDKYLQDQARINIILFILKLLHPDSIILTMTQIRSTVYMPAPSIADLNCKKC